MQSKNKTLRKTQIFPLKIELNLTCQTVNFKMTNE